MKRINFSKNWNNKLDCEFFTTVRPVEGKSEYTPGETVEICIDHKLFSKAVVWVDYITRIKNVNTIVSHIDAGLSPEKFYELIKEIYGNESFWKDKDTYVHMLLLKRVDE